MARKKPIEAMSAEELYELAKAKEQEEFERERETIKQQIQELRGQRRELLARHKREVAALDKQIRELGGRTGGNGRGRRGNVSDRVVEIINRSGEISTRDLQAQLEEEGVMPKNLGQTLAYLKRTGRVTTPRRAVYAPAR